MTVKDDINVDNLDACLTKTSKTLGQCILECEDDSSCENSCVHDFKESHSKCPCQVHETGDVFLLFHSLLIIG